MVHPTEAEDFLKSLPFPCSALTCGACLSLRLFLQQTLWQAHLLRALSGVCRKFPCMPLETKVSSEKLNSDPALCSPSVPQRSLLWLSAGWCKSSLWSPECGMRQSFLPGTVSPSPKLREGKLGHLILTPYLSSTYLPSFPSQFPRTIPWLLYVST